MTDPAAAPARAAGVPAPAPVPPPVAAPPPAGVFPGGASSPAGGEPSRPAAPGAAAVADSSSAPDEAPAAATAAAIRAAVAPLPVPFVGVWEQATSTNDLARAAAADIGPALAAGSVFLAERQTAGRGRFGRRWASPPGGLYLSLLVAAPPGEGNAPAAARFSLLPLAAGLAAAEAVEHTVGLRPELRWPNDLDLDGGKIGGVLLETGLPAPPPSRGGADDAPAPPLAIVGFGINLGPVALEADPGTEADAPGAPGFRPPGGADPGTEADARAPLRPPAWLPPATDRTRLAAALTAAFHRQASAAFRAPEPFVARWEAASPTARGARCRARLADGRLAAGCTEGLAPDGALRVRLDSGALVAVHASDALSFVPDFGPA